MESWFVAGPQLGLIINSGPCSCATLQVVTQSTQLPPTNIEATPFQNSIFRVARLKVHGTRQLAPIKFPQQESLSPFIFSPHLALPFSFNLNYPTFLKCIRIMPDIICFVNTGYRVFLFRLWFDMYLSFYKVPALTNIQFLPRTPLKTT